VLPTHADILTRIAQHFRLPVEAVQFESSLVYDLGADSSDVLDLCIQVSDHYGCDLNTEQITRLRTVGDFYQLVHDACVSTPSGNLVQ
jgi:acyl carrier protein